MILIIMHSIPDPLDKIAIDQRRRISCAPEQSLFRQGDKTVGVYFILSGRLDLIRHTMSGDKVVIHRASAGQTFAEASLFSESYHCDARVRECSEVVRFNRTAVLGAFHSNPEFALSLTKRFALQLQQYRRRMELLAIKRATDRVYAAMADGLLSGTIMDFAAEIGLTQEAVYRALAKLCKSGNLSKTGRGRYIINERAKGLAIPQLDAQ